MYKYDRKRIEKDMLSWWNFEEIGRPIVRIMGYDEPIQMPEEPADAQMLHLDPSYKMAAAKAVYDGATFYGEAFQSLELNLGPGSMATYLGSEPIFHRDTIWFSEVAENSLEELGELRYNPDNKWWKYHLDVVTRGAALCKGTAIIPNIPDILENIDILSLLRSPQELCYDIIDEPEVVHRYIGQIDDIYFDYYDPMYELIKDGDGGCSYTAFSIIAPEKCAKIQCDFAALMSPGQFREFIIPSLKKQCEKIPYTLFHLDGPDAIRHIEALMEIEELNAINWVPGSAEADGGDEKWYPLYDKVIEAGKSLWIALEHGGVERFIALSRKLVERYGSSRGFYLHYPMLPNRDAKRLYEASLREFQE
ncbi:MAG: hypothetical protein ACK5LX_14715 [Oscillospiraceae bacterium]